MWITTFRLMTHHQNAYSGYDGHKDRATAKRRSTPA